MRRLPGMGATLTAEFLAEAGDLTRFASANQLASAAGLAPVLQQSGKKGQGRSRVGRSWRRGGATLSSARRLQDRTCSGRFRSVTSRWDCW
ncbi:transposase [Saccharopolyspora shandongensis]|uniref:transposase n=1 Tax=Saccharopolyspora shandongensis TaxID=418495 RepID=UPI0034449FE9